LIKAPKTYPEEYIVSSKKVVGITGYLHAEN
jgi:hypothetical protein